MNSLDNISKDVFNCKRCGLCKENEGKIALKTLILLTYRLSL